jgi:hypothetical protein
MPSDLETAIIEIENNQILLEDEAPADEAEQPFEFDEEEDNLVPVFMAHSEGKELLKKIASEVKNMYDRHWEAQEENRKRQKADYKMFLADLPPKNEPFANCANLNVPITTKNLLMLTCRSYDEIFGNWSNVFGVQPVGPDDQLEADILSTHGNWQLREKILDFPAQMFRAVFQFHFAGDVTATSYYDEFTQTNRHEVLTCDQFVCPYTYVSTRPDYSDCPWYAIIQTYYRHELQALRDDWFGVDRVLEKTPVWDDEPEQPVREGVEKVEGILKPSEGDRRGPYKIILWKGWLQLPNQSRDRWCEIHMDYATTNILKMRISEIPPWSERIRYERQQAELNDYMAAISEYETLAGQAAIMLDAAERNPFTEYAAVEQARQHAQGIISARPPAPAWYQPEMGARPPQMKKRPVYLESHAVCFTPMAGNLGIGSGRILADINRAANIAIDQFIDAASFANGPPTFHSKHVEMPKRMEYAPGKFIPVETSGADLRQAILPVPHTPANPQLMEVVSRAYAWGETVTSTTEVLSGEPGKSGEAWRSYAARVEQATKMPSVLTRKFANEFVRQILLNNAFLNSYFLPNEEIFGVNDHLGFHQMKITRSMYNRDYNVTFHSDMQYTTKAEKQGKADDIMGLAQMLMGLFTQMGMPQVAWPFMYMAYKRVLESREAAEMLTVLPPPDMQFQLPTPPEGQGQQGQKGASGPTGNAPAGPPQKGE